MPARRSRAAGSCLVAILLILSVFSIVTITTAFAQAAMSTTAQSEFLTLKEPTTSFKPTDVVFFEKDDDDNSIALYMFDWCNILPPTVPNLFLTHTAYLPTKNKKVSRPLF